MSEYLTVIVHYDFNHFELKNCNLASAFGFNLSISTDVLQCETVVSI